LNAIARRFREVFLAGAEEESLRSVGRPLTPDEQTRVLRHYPGDWFRPEGELYRKAVR
jgi:hypothetical protein